MKFTHIALVALLGASATALVFAQTGPGGGPGMGPMRGVHGAMGGRMGPAMQHDAATPADMQLVHEMVMKHDQIKRTVTNLPNGIRTVTESDDPSVTQAIQTHVVSMEGRLADGRVFNRFSETLPVLFDAKDKLKSQVQITAKGAIVTQTSDDPVVVAALQAHAQEVSELARDGQAAMMRSAMASRAH
jgi:hypothetical protein